MQLNINNILIKTLNAHKESNPSIEKNQNIKVEVNINISLIDYKKLGEGIVLLKSSFVLDMLDFGHIDAQLDIIVKTDSEEELISEWNSTNGNLSSINRIKIDNSVFHYIMPLVLHITEKMKMPIPLPLLSNGNIN